MKGKSLKKCPFCNADPRVTYPITTSGTVIYCPNGHASIGGAGVTNKDAWIEWNNRYN